MWETYINVEPEVVRVECGCSFCGKNEYLTLDTLADDGSLVCANCLEKREVRHMDIWSVQIFGGLIPPKRYLKVA